MAGRLGCGGGPGVAFLRIVFAPLRFGEASGLEEEEGDHAHRCMPVQPLP